MPFIVKPLTRALLFTSALLATSASYAATQPGSVTAFTDTLTYDVFTVSSKGWRDPAFGDMGWTHKSDWGSFTAKKGQTVTITLISETAGIHPGISIWFRGKDDTAPNSYVVDHFYPQQANFTKFGATDESTGASIGDIVMRIQKFGYDLDGNTQHVKGINGKKDGVPGQLQMTFTANRTGSYMFVVGGFNPDATVDPTIKSFNIDTTVTVTTP